MLKILPDDVVNKIAAGEVVERPVSIVRELVDNAIDAGSSSVTVEIVEGGQSLIRVTDNGSGMSRAEAELCFRRHATSKIHSVSDLESISTLGFRGEALSSIAAVANVRLKTRREADELGTELQSFEGQISSIRSCTLQPGSEFEVSKLFSTLPARRKFLKTARTDQLRIQEWLYQSVLAHPSVRFRFVADGKEIFRFSEHSDIFSRLESLISGSSVRVNYSAGPFSVKGIVAHPSQADFKPGNFTFLVNARPVQDKILMRSLRDAWSSAMRSAENPVGCLEITLPACEVDVNVHPQKSEVRFRNSQAVFGSLYKAVKAGLSEWKPELRSLQLANPPSSGSEVIWVQADAGAAEEKGSAALLQPHSATQQPAIISERFIGQILGVYLIFERAEKTYLLDLHAAHERIRFNELSSWAVKAKASSQRMLLPLHIELTELETEYLHSIRPQLTEYGLQFDISSDGISVHEIPTCLSSTELPEFLRNLAKLEISDVATALQKTIEKVLARKACRSSVMSGEKLQPEQARSLWEQIRNEPQGAVCPHGRPVMVELSRSEIDKLFLRDGF